MFNVLTIVRREMRSYFGSPWSYLITAAFLIVSGYGFGWSSVTYLETSIQGFMGWCGFFLLFLAPALTMRLLAEEEKLGTLELLMTSPVRDVEVIVGKYLSGLSMFCVMLMTSFYYPILLFWFGKPDPGPIISGYLGLFLLGAVYLAIGLFASSLTANQVVAFVIGSIIVIFFWFIDGASDMVGDTAADILRGLSLSADYPKFSRGIIDTNAIIYYLNILLLFLFLTVRSLETRRWRS